MNNLECPLCGLKWDAGIYNETVVFRHVCVDHLGTFQSHRFEPKIMCRCWCGIEREGELRLGNQSYTSRYAPMWNHWESSGGLVAHFLAHQLKENS